MNEQQRPKFTYLGHSTVRCDLPEGEVILIDPWVHSNPVCPQGVSIFERLDTVLITHSHSDHMGDAVEICQQYKPETVVANYEICQWLSDHGVQGCSPMNTGGAQEISGGRVTMVPALHSSSIQDGDRLVYGGDPGGYVVRLANGYTFYHAGDTALFSDMRLIAELWSPTLAFLPIGDLFTMDPRQAAHAARFLAVEQVVPVHWGTFPALTGKPEGLRAALDDLYPACEVVTLAPGESW